MLLQHERLATVGLFFFRRRQRFPHAAVAVVEGEVSRSLPTGGCHLRAKNKLVIDLKLNPVIRAGRAKDRRVSADGGKFLRWHAT